MRWLRSYALLVAEDGWCRRMPLDHGELEILCDIQFHLFISKLNDMNQFYFMFTLIFKILVEFSTYKQEYEYFMQIFLTGEPDIVEFTNRIVPVAW